MVERGVYIEESTINSAKLDFEKALEKGLQEALSLI